MEQSLQFILQHCLYLHQANIRGAAPFLKSCVTGNFLPPLSLSITRRRTSLVIVISFCLHPYTNHGFRLLRIKEICIAVSRNVLDFSGVSRIPSECPTLYYTQGFSAFFRQGKTSTILVRKFELDDFCTKLDQLFEFSNKFSCQLQKTLICRKKPDYTVVLPGNNLYSIISLLQKYLRIGLVNFLVYPLRTQSPPLGHQKPAPSDWSIRKSSQSKTACFVLLFCYWLVLSY